MHDAFDCHVSDDVMNDTTDALGDAGVLYVVTWLNHPDVRYVRCSHTSKLMRVCAAACVEDGSALAAGKIVANVLASYDQLIS